jgi:hypothetical protein
MHVQYCIMFEVLHICANGVVCKAIESVNFLNMGLKQTQPLELYFNGQLGVKSPKMGALYPSN